MASKATALSTELRGLGLSSQIVIRERADDDPVSEAIRGLGDLAADRDSRSGPTRVNDQSNYPAGLRSSSIHALVVAGGGAGFGTLGPSLVLVVTSSESLTWSMRDELAVFPALVALAAITARAAVRTG